MICLFLYDPSFDVGVESESSCTYSCMILYHEPLYACLSLEILLGTRSLRSLRIQRRGAGGNTIIKNKPPPHNGKLPCHRTVRYLALQRQYHRHTHLPSLSTIHKFTPSTVLLINTAPSQSYSDSVLSFLILINIVISSNIPTASMNTAIMPSTVGGIQLKKISKSSNWNPFFNSCYHR